MIVSGIGDGGLHGQGLEITVPDLYRDATGKFIVAAEFECNFFGHPHEFFIQELHIDGIGFKSIFRADTFETDTIDMQFLNKELVRMTEKLRFQLRCG